LFEHSQKNNIYYQAFVASYSGFSQLIAAVGAGVSRQKPFDFFNSHSLVDFQLWLGTKKCKKTESFCAVVILGLSVVVTYNKGNDYQ
jgi:hypothetical protein